MDKQCCCKAIAQCTILNATGIVLSYAVPALWISTALHHSFETIGAKVEKVLGRPCVARAREYCFLFHSLSDCVAYTVITSLFLEFFVSRAPLLWGMGLG